MRPRALIIALVVVAAVWLARGRLFRLVHRDAAAVDAGGRATAGADGAAAPDFAEVNLSGRAVELSLLSGPPATDYLGPQDDRPGDDGYRAAVRAAMPDAIYDPYLARAAGEIAAQSAALGARPPDGALAFLLHSAGAPESTVAQFVLRTNSPGPEALERAVRGALAQPTSGSGPLHVGVGEASAEGKGLDRNIVVLTARRAYQLDPTPRSAAPGTHWRVRGSAPDHRELTAAVLYPDGKLADVPVARDGDRFEVNVPTGESTGQVAMSIDGVGPSGPDKLLQLTVEVGDALPQKIDVLVPPSEDDLGDLASAERFAYELLSLDRRRLGVPPLQLDLALSAVARAHSDEMHDRGFFGHRSPTTGLVSDRLRAAGYRSSATGENLALNDGIAEAEASLMASVGHRKNIAQPLFTHVGIGLARREHDDGRVELVADAGVRPAGDHRRCRRRRGRHPGAAGACPRRCRGPRAGAGSGAGRGGAERGRARLQRHARWPGRSRRRRGATAGRGRRRLHADRLRAHRRVAAAGRRRPAHDPLRGRRRPGSGLWPGRCGADRRQVTHGTAHPRTARGRERRLRRLRAQRR